MRLATEFTTPHEYCRQDAELIAHSPVVFDKLFCYPRRISIRFSFCHFPKIADKFGFFQLIWTTHHLVELDNLPDKDKPHLVCATGGEG